MTASFLLMIGEREALAWILKNSRMAFSPTTRSQVERLEVGDDLFLVTTRGCFHNPGRDRTRIIGRAVVTSPVEPLVEAVRLAGREFTRGCTLSVGSLAPYLEGVEVAPLVDRLDLFPNKSAWSTGLRRTLVPLAERDARLVARELEGVASTPASHVHEYLRRIKPVASVRAPRPTAR